MDAAVQDISLPAELVVLIVDALLNDISQSLSLKSSLSVLSSLALVCLSFRHIVNFIRFNSVSLKVWIRPDTAPSQDRVSQLTALLDADTKIWGGEDTQGIRSTVAQHIKTLSLEVIVVSGGQDCDLSPLIPILSKVFQSRRTWRPSQFTALALYQLDPQMLSLSFDVWGDSDSRPAKWTSMNSRFVHSLEQFLETSTVEAFFLKNCIHIPQTLLHVSNFSCLGLQDVKLDDRSPAPIMEPRNWDTLVLVLDAMVLGDLARAIAKVKKLVVLSAIVLDDLFFPLNPTPTAVKTLYIRMTSDTKKESSFFNSFRDVRAPEARFPNVTSMLLDTTLCKTNRYSQTHHPFTPPIVSNVQQLECQFGVNVPRSVSQDRIVAFIAELFLQYDMTTVDRHIALSSGRASSRLRLVVLHFYISHETFRYINADSDSRLKADLADLVFLTFSCINASRKMALSVKFTLDDNGEAICRKRRADCSGFFRK